MGVTSNKHIVLVNTGCIGCSAKLLNCEQTLYFQLVLW